MKKLWLAVLLSLLPSLALAQGWVRLTPNPLRPPPGGGQVVFDAHRGKAVFRGNGLWEYDGSRWVEVHPAHEPTSFFPLVYDSVRQQVMGFDGQLVHYYDGTDWTAVTPVAVPPQRSGFGLAFDEARGKAVLFSGGLGYTDTWTWDGTTWTLATNSGPSGRSGPGMVYDSVRQKVVLVGGFVLAVGPTPWYETWEWNGSSWTQIPVTVRPPADQGFAVAYDASRAKVVFRSPGTSAPQVLYEYDGSDWTKVTTPAVAPSGRNFASFWYDPVRARSYLFGGVDNLAIRYDDLWSWDGTAWEKVAGLSGPSEAAYRPIAHDPVRHQTVVYGGSFGNGGKRSGTYLFDGAAWSQPLLSYDPGANSYGGMDLVWDTERQTVAAIGPPAVWDWDGAKWTYRNPGTGPGRLGGQATAYDPIRLKAFVFGGAANSTLVNDTWSLSGTVWTKLAPTTSPSPRIGSKMYFDPETSKLVLVGPPDGSGDLEVWDFDGVDWAQRTLATTPSRRTGFGLAYDPMRKKAVMFGGDGASGRLAETWELDASGWTQVQTVSSPGAFSGSSLTYDETLGKVVLVNGDSGRYLSNDTWAFDPQLVVAPAPGGDDGGTSTDGGTDGGIPPTDGGDGGSPPATPAVGCGCGASAEAALLPGVLLLALLCVAARGQRAPR